MSIFTLDQGSFAGHTIRITPDHFASIYDVIRVASGVKNPHDTWNTVQTRFSGDATSKTSPSTTSVLPTSAFGTPPASGQAMSEEVPMIKTFKFAGRGQRN